MNKKIFKNGIIAIFPVLMIMSLVYVGIPPAHANDCLGSAQFSLNSLVPGEINQPTADGIYKKLVQAESKLLDGKIADSDQKIQDAKDKVQQLFDRNKITGETRDTLNEIIDEFQFCISG